MQSWASSSTFFQTSECMQILGFFQLLRFKCISLQVNLPLHTHASLSLLQLCECESLAGKFHLRGRGRDAVDRDLGMKLYHSWGRCLSRLFQSVHSE